MMGAWELLIILGVVVVIILWGPTKIPELAKAVGRAKGEFDKASRDYRSGKLTQPSPKSEVSNDDILLQLAKAAGIDTAGKDRTQIVQALSQTLKTVSTKT